MFPGEYKYRDKYLYIIHKIMQDRVYNNHKDYESYVPLKTEILRNVVGGYHLKRIMGNMISTGIIEIDGQYIPGKKSIGYRLSDAFRGKGIKEAELLDKRINTRTRLFRAKQAKELPKEIEYQALKTWLDKIEIDFDDAVEFIKADYLRERKKVIIKLKRLKLEFSTIPALQTFNCFKYLIQVEEINNELLTIRDKFDCALISIKNLHHKEHFMITDKAAGRVHTNITNLKSEIRQFLRVGGKKLFNIDIRNSQPFLFNILIKYYFSIGQKRTFSSIFSCFSTFSKTNNDKLNILPYDAGFDDLRLYQELTSGGKFYEYLMDKMGLTGMQRQSFKKSFFGKVFFSKNNKNYVYHEKKIFKQHFPHVYEAIHNFKKKAHRDLPIALQKAEVNIMINTIVRRIATERPDVFLTTIHDSIMTTEDNIEYVKTVILDEFERNFKMKPSLKVE